MNGQTHLDQEIIRLMNKTKGYKIAPPVGADTDIGTGMVLIGGVRIYFEPRTLLDGKVRMTLPRDFQSVPPEKVYQPKARPDLLLVDASGAIQITLAHLAQKVNNDADIIAHKDGVQHILGEMNSSLEWLPGGVKEICGKQAAFFEFVAPMMGTNVYNLSFFMELNQRVLNGSFVCNANKLKAWKPLFDQMFESIEILAPKQNASAENRHPDFSQYPFDEGLYAIYNDRDYRMFKVGPDQYRLLSTHPEDSTYGFIRKDGLYKKTVCQHEIPFAYRLKLTLIYQGYAFEIRQQLKNSIELKGIEMDEALAGQLQFKMNEDRQYAKWVAKEEIEDVIETRLPVEGFAMPEKMN